MGDEVRRVCWIHPGGMWCLDEDGGVGADAMWSDSTLLSKMCERQKRMCERD